MGEGEAEGEGEWGKGDGWRGRNGGRGAEKEREEIIVGGRVCSLTHVLISDSVRSLCLI